jgi:hypothetical protein
MDSKLAFVGIVFMRRFPILLSFSLLAGLIVGGPNAARAQCALPYTLTNTQPADATQVMANFNALVACLNLGGATNALQYNAGSGVLGGVGPLGNGQLVIGSTGNAPQAATLAAGTGISITNGPGSISIAASSPIGLYRQIMSATPTSASIGLTNWLNQGTATVTDSATGVCIDAPTTGTTVNTLGRYGAAPSTPYKITALIAATRTSNSFSGVGIGWYDGTNKIHVITHSINSGTSPYILVGKLATPTTYTANDFVSALNAFAQPVWLQIGDDGTNVSFAFSYDGTNFLTVFSVAKASGFLGATGYSNLLFWVDPRGSRTLGTIMSWTQS